MKLLAACIACVTALAQSVAPIDLLYAGSWRLNPSKSDFGETTVTYAPGPASGEMRFTAMGQTTVTLTPDGRPLTTFETGPKQTGGTFERTTIYRRASGDGKGLVGAWKTRNPPRMPRHVDLVVSGIDGLTITFPDDKESCIAKFDGQDYPLTGPIAQPSMTLALRKTGPRSFDVTGKQYGKPIFTIAFTVSADGQTLTQTGRMTGANEPFTAVHDRP